MCTACWIFYSTGNIHVPIIEHRRILLPQRTEPEAHFKLRIRLVIPGDGQRLTVHFKTRPLKICAIPSRIEQQAKTNSRPQSFHFHFFVLKHNSLYRRTNGGRHIGYKLQKDKIRLAESDGSRLRNNREMIKIQQSRVFLTPPLIFRFFCVFAHCQLKKVVESLEIVETTISNDHHQFVIYWNRELSFVKYQCSFYYRPHDDLH